jgi:hypothetical protein
MTRPNVSISRRRETDVVKRECAPFRSSVENAPDSPVGCMHLLGSRRRCVRAGRSAALPNATERPELGALPRSRTLLCLARRRRLTPHAAALVLPSVAVCCGCSLRLPKPRSGAAGSGSGAPLASRSTLRDAPRPARAGTHIIHQQKKFCPPRALAA